MAPTCLPKTPGGPRQADVWAAISPSLSLEDSVKLLSESRGRHTGSEHVSTYREQNAGLPVSTEQCANCSDELSKKPLPGASSLANTDEAAEYTRGQSDTCSVNSNCVK